MSGKGYSPPDCTADTLEATRSRNRLPNQEVARSDVQFETTNPGANVSFWITDYRPHVDTMIEWAELLNPPERTQPYAEWLRANL